MRKKDTHRYRTKSPCPSDSLRPGGARHKHPISQSSQPCPRGCLRAAHLRRRPCGLQVGPCWVFRYKLAIDGAVVVVVVVAGLADDGVYVSDAYKSKSRVGVEIPDMASGCVGVVRRLGRTLVQ